MCIYKAINKTNAGEATLYFKKQNILGSMEVFHVVLKVQSPVRMPKGNHHPENLPLLPVSFSLKKNTLCQIIASFACVYDQGISLVVYSVSSKDFPSSPFQMSCV